jgi:maltose alpha-D-glucosyltransferase / alpha-amylase
VRSWTDGVLQRAGRTLDDLVRRRSDLTENDRQRVDALLSYRESLPARLRELLPETIAAMKIRHHGFHLEQMLIVKDDVSVMDFEGEPRRSIADRRRKAPAARDVAGLIRSVDYSATAALERALKSAPDEHGKIACALEGWRKHSVAAFLSAYRPSYTRLWPQSLQDADLLLDFFLWRRRSMNRIRTCASAGSAAGAVGRHLAYSLAFGGRAAMSSLTPEAYAVIEGLQLRTAVWTGVTRDTMP